MNFKEIKELMAQFDGSDIYSAEIETDGVKLKFKKTAPVHQISAPVVSQPVPVSTPITAVAQTAVTNVPEQPEAKQAAADSSQNGVAVTAPLVGVVYQAKAPDAEPFVKVGQSVKGQTVCLIEAMKMMNEVSSPANGIVKEILFKDGELVAFNDTIMVIEEQ